jgi:hypothetical protein
MDRVAVCVLQACHLPTAKKLRHRWMLNDDSLLLALIIYTHTHHGIVIIHTPWSSSEYRRAFSNNLTRLNLN